MTPPCFLSHRFKWINFLLGSVFLVALACPAWSAEDPRLKALDDFLWSRTQANGVIEYTYMTDHLKDYFRGKRKVKVLQKSSLLLTFRYDPNGLQEKDGGKSFVVDVVGVWKNLNDHLVGEIDERDTFVKTPKGWLADEVKFGKERAEDLAVVEGLSSSKDYRDALHVLKIVMRAWAEQDFPTAEKLLSPDFEGDFRSPQELRLLLVGVPNPHHVAFAIRRIARADNDRIAFDVDLYEMNAGDPRLITGRATLDVKQFDTAWLVDGWTLTKSDPTFR